MPNPAGNYDAYKKVSVETASQGKLVYMLFNSAIQRSEEARNQIPNRNYARVHENLIRAQVIIQELRRALNTDMGEIPRELDRLYEYFEHLLIQGNIRKDPKPIEECVELMTQMRDTWKEAFAIAEREHAPSSRQSASSPPLGNHAAVSFEG